MKRNIVFLSNLPCLWDSMRTIYEHFNKDTQFNVYVIAQNQEFFFKKNIPSIDNLNGTFDLNRVNPDIIFREVPYCEQLPNNFKIDSLIHLRSAPKICYVPYSACFHPPFPISKFFFGHSFFEYCWKIFVATEPVRNAYHLFCAHDKKKEKFIISGSPKLDVYLENSENISEPTWRLNRKNVPDVKRVIWTAHSTISHAIYEDNTAHNNYSKGFSTFMKYKEFLISLAKKYPKIELVFRPHPSLFYNLLTQHHMEKQELDNYLNKLCSLENATVFPTLEQDYFDLFLSSDALISDFSSTLAEYLPTKKPILFLQREDAPDLGPWYKNAKHYYRAHAEKDIEEFIERVVIKEKDILYDERIKILKEHLYIPKEGSGKFIKEHIAQELEKEESKIFSFYNDRNSIQNNNAIILHFRKILESMKINSVLDLGCGKESIFYSKYLASKMIYTGIDIDLDLISEKANWFSSLKNMKFHALDITSNELPQADLIFCENLLHLFTTHQIWKLLSSIVNSKSKYLIMGQTISSQNNKPCLELCNDPFFLPVPLWHHVYPNDNWGIACWEIETLRFYIPHLKTGDISLRNYKKNLIDKILLLIEDFKCIFALREDLFVRIIQSFSNNYDFHNQLLTSEEIKNIATYDAYKIITSFFYIIYGDQANQKITELLPEAEYIHFDITKSIVKDIFNGITSQYELANTNG